MSADTDLGEPYVFTYVSKKSFNPTVGAHLRATGEFLGLIVHSESGYLAYLVEDLLGRKIWNAPYGGTFRTRTDAAEWLVRAIRLPEWR